VDSGEIAHDEVEHDSFLGSVFPFDETAEALRVLHSVVGRDHAVRLLVVGMKYVRTVRRVDDVADGAVGGGLAADDFELLPPGGLELEPDLDGRRIGELTDGVALSEG